MLFDLRTLPLLTVFTGGFGSGKTELSITTSLNLIEYEPVILVDLDLVKPMFRSREASHALTSKGVRLVSSVKGLEHIDLPALDPELTTIVSSSYNVDSNQKKRVIIDVGGDELGAKALGRFAPSLDIGTYGMYMVVNPYRPFTKDVEGVGRLLSLIEQRSRLKVTGIISNPNIGRGTSIHDFMKGHETVCRISNEIGLSILFAGIRHGLFYERDNETSLDAVGVPLLPISQHMLPPWVVPGFDSEEG